ncbi:MAG: serine O-acetyltransferase [Leptospirales bacterium]|nr:serine O-acetyltransferase [Leptospirales bacterium]
MSGVLPASLSAARAIFERRRELRDLHPLKRASEAFINDLLGAFFPHHANRPIASESDMAAALAGIEEELVTVLRMLREQLGLSVEAKPEDFFERLPQLYARLLADAESLYQGDPAAESVDEVILAYPGFLAIAMFRIAHELHLMEIPVAPRLMTECAHRLTGIDIHPGARIGAAFCIDHGTGVVIGETTIIGDNVKLYQGVTLGALSVDKDLARQKRHPTIEDRVVIYAGATILGGDTTIGHDSVIGGNVWLTSSVPAHSLVTHRSGDRVRDRRLRKDFEIDFVI